MSSPQRVEDYLAEFPTEIASRLQLVRELVLREVAAVGGQVPEERMRYGIAAVMLGGRYALHFAGWKHHIGLYPVPTLPEPLESEVASYRTGKDTLSFQHRDRLPEELIARVVAAVVAARGQE
jgi:uncharacterized protein YdhG (YjbR/CyaY superfamily)